MPTTTSDLRSALSEALVLADGEAIDAADLLIDAVARHLGIDPATLEVGVPLPAEPAERPQWCSVCKTYHVDVGVRTDAGAPVKPCPRIPADDPRQQGLR